MKPHKQFSLRDLVWLILMCAISVSWWIDHRRLATAEANALAQPAQLKKQVRKLQADIMNIRLSYVKQRRDLKTLEAEFERQAEQLALATRYNARNGQ